MHIYIILCIYAYYIYTYLHKKQPMGIYLTFFVRALSWCVDATRFFHVLSWDRFVNISERLSYKFERFFTFSTLWP